MKITLKQWAKDNGVVLTLNEQGRVRLSESHELMEILEEAMSDGTCPCLCDECDNIEPDGICSHGGKSLLLACGMI